MRPTRSGVHFRGPRCYATSRTSSRRRRALPLPTCRWARCISASNRIAEPCSCRQADVRRLHVRRTPWLQWRSPTWTSSSAEQLNQHCVENTSASQACDCHGSTRPPSSWSRPPETVELRRRGVGGGGFLSLGRVPNGLHLLRPTIAADPGPPRWTSRVRRDRGGVAKSPEPTAPRPAWPAWHAPWCAAEDHAQRSGMPRLASPWSVAGRARGTSANPPTHLLAGRRRRADWPGPAETVCIRATARFITSPVLASAPASG